MAFKLFVLAALVAVANAGVASYGYAAPAAYAAPGLVHSTALTSDYTNTYRGLAGQSSITNHAKTLDTPFSSVRKYDSRLTNDAVAYAPAVAKAVGYGAPIAHAAYAAPVAHAAYAAPVAHAAYAAPVAHAAYAAPVAHAAYAAPVAHAAYAAPAIAKVAAPAYGAYGAYGAYAAPAVAKVAAPAYAGYGAYAAPALAKTVAPAGLLGVAYSAAPAVATMSFNGYGINYAY